MSQNLEKQRVEQVSQRIKHWIQEGAALETAQWQGALESMLAAMEHFLIPGAVITAEGLSETEAELFHKLFIALDLSPFVAALYLPPALSGKLKAKDPMDRKAENGSHRLIARNPNHPDRILTAELAPEAPNGADIYQDGKRLGSYDYQSQQESIAQISKLIWVHLKPPRLWRSSDQIQYTENWFFRAAVGGIRDLPVNARYSYLHEPQRLGLTRIEAVFKLMAATLSRLYEDPDQTIAAANAANAYEPDPLVAITPDGLRTDDPAQKKALCHFLANQLGDLLRLLHGYGIVDFQAMDPNEEQSFYQQFDQTVARVCAGVQQAVSM